MKQALSVLLLILIISACTKDEVINPPDVTGPLATFPDLQYKVFSSCATINCHSSNTKKADLDLTDANSYQNLVNIQSTLYPQLKRVVPYKPEESVVMGFLRGQFTPQMPMNGSLPHATVDSIESWIRKGAKRD
jgi:hypothetical protein